VVPFLGQRHENRSMGLLDHEPRLGPQPSSDVGEPRRGPERREHPLHKDTQVELPATRSATSDLSFHTGKCGCRRTRVPGTTILRCDQFLTFLPGGGDKNVPSSMNNTGTQLRRR
jgi:hypothetical protein